MLPKAKFEALMFERVLPVTLTSPTMFEALMELKPAPFPLTFEVLRVPMLAVVTKRLGV